AAYSCGGSHGFPRYCGTRVPSFVPGATRGTSTAKCTSGTRGRVKQGLNATPPACSPASPQSGALAARLLDGVLHALHLLVRLEVFDVADVMPHVTRVLHVRLTGVLDVLLDLRGLLRVSLGRLPGGDRRGLGRRSVVLREGRASDQAQREHGGGECPQHGRCPCLRRAAVARVVNVGGPACRRSLRTTLSAPY